jgi:cation diffusion facilitator family transporter
MIKEKCTKCGNRVGIISVIASLLLAFFKFGIGFRSGSHALMANAFYSIQDVISSLIVIWSTSFSGRKPDRKYPYGYGKIEYVASSILSVVIIIGVVLVLYFAGMSVFEGPRRPGMLAVWGTVVSFFAAYILYIYIKCAGNTLNSPVMKSNAKHFHLDMISSVCVGIAIIITKLGFRHLDPIIAIFEGIDIIVTSVEIFSHGVKGLMDTAISDDDVEKYRESITKVAGVKALTSLRTRELGRERQVDIEIEIDGGKRLEQVDKIKNEVRNSLAGFDQNIAFTNISIAPFQSTQHSDRQTVALIAKILSKYYRSFIKRHELEITDSRIKLVVHFLPEIPSSSCRLVSGDIKEKIENDISDKEISVIAKGKVKTESMSNSSL